MQLPVSLWRAGNPHRQTWAIETKHGEHLAQQSAWMAVFGSHSCTPSTQCGIACGGCKSLGLLSRIFASHLSEVRRTFQVQHVGGACEPHENGWRTVCLLQPWLRTGRCRAPLHHSGQAAAQRRRGIPQAVVAEGTDNVLLSQTACLRQRRGSLTRTNSIPTLVRDLAKLFPWRSGVCPMADCPSNILVRLACAAPSPPRGMCSRVATTPTSTSAPTTLGTGCGVFALGIVLILRLCSAAIATTSAVSSALLV